MGAPYGNKNAAGPHTGKNRAKNQIARSKKRKISQAKMMSSFEMRRLYKLAHPKKQSYSYLRKR